MGLPILAAAKTVVETFNSPLEFQPGTSWNYGTGIDWAGLLVARIANIDLETYFQENIFKPLGHFIYSFSMNPELVKRL